MLTWTNQRGGQRMEALPSQLIVVAKRRVIHAWSRIRKPCGRTTALSAMEGRWPPIRFASSMWTVPPVIRSTTIEWLASLPPRIPLVRGSRSFMCPQRSAKRKKGSRRCRSQYSKWLKRNRSDGPPKLRVTPQLKRGKSREQSDELAHPELVLLQRLTRLFVTMGGS
jgi:hypothetical protein